MIAGRKLLLADDSVAIQKVIDLTFSDEGMEVTTVGDGQLALEKLADVAPDVILADVFMPGLDGYELCKFIKQSERFRKIPVMLLIGSFEPFDEAEARRVGADDIVTKPFQSIRQLVGRVGSLLGGKSGDEEDRVNQYSTLGIGRANVESQTSVISAESNSETIGARNCQADIEMQTADTMRLTPVEAQFPEQKASSKVDEEIIANEPMIDAEESVTFLTDTPKTGYIVSTGGSEIPRIEPDESADAFSGPLLDLGDIRGAAPAIFAEDFVLDIGDEASPGAGEASFESIPQVAVPVVDAVLMPDVSSEESSGHTVTLASAAASHEWARVSQGGAAEAASLKSEDSRATATAAQINLSDLPPEAIDAIARRAIEQLSDKVVREIAWEVVPELAELLIKQRLEEQKQ